MLVEIRGLATNPLLWNSWIRLLWRFDVFNCWGCLTWRGVWISGLPTRRKTSLLTFRRVVWGNCLEECWLVITETPWFKFIFSFCFQDNCFVSDWITWGDGVFRKVVVSKFFNWLYSSFWGASTIFSLTSLLSSGFFLKINLACSFGLAMFSPGMSCSLTV